MIQLASPPERSRAARSARRAPASRNPNAGRTCAMTEGRVRRGSARPCRWWRSLERLHPIESSYGLMCPGSMETRIRSTTCTVRITRQNPRLAPPFGHANHAQYEDRRRPHRRPPAPVFARPATPERARENDQRDHQREEDDGDELRHEPQREAYAANAWGCHARARGGRRGPCEGVIDPSAIRQHERRFHVVAAEPAGRAPATVARRAPGPLRIPRPVPPPERDPNTYRNAMLPKSASQKRWPNSLSGRTPARTPAAMSQNFREAFRGTPCRAECSAESSSPR